MMNNNIVIQEEFYKNLKKLNHELKTPVTNLNLVLEMLYEYDKTLSVSRKKEILRLGLAEIKRLQDLIDYFSNFNYLFKFKEKKSEQLQSLDVTNRIASVYDVLSFQKNVFVKSYKCDKNSVGVVNIDSKTYKNVIFNLLGNASKFINYDGWIILEVDIITSISLISFNYINFSRSAVIDNGVGMTYDIQYLIKSSSLFPYNNRQRIGLAIVREILSTYCLILDVVSYPYRGAKLYFNMRIIQSSSD